MNLNINLFSVFIGVMVLCLLPNIGFAQTEDSEIIKINTEAAQISLAVEQGKPKPFRIELTDNGLKAENIYYESAKDSPLQVVVIVAMNPAIEKSEINQPELLKQLYKLSKDKKSFNLLGVNLVRDTDNLSGKLKIDSVVPTVSFDGIENAVESGIARLQSVKGLRKSILLLTNEIESLPEDIIEKTNLILGKSSAAIYLMSLNQKGAVYNKKTRKTDKIIARSNINGASVTVFLDSYIDGLFRTYKSMADNLYTVSFQVADETAEDHFIQAEAIGLDDNKIIDYNNRKLLIPRQTPIIKVAAQVNNLSPAEIALNELRQQDLNVLLSRRHEKLSDEAVRFYEQELRNHQNFKNVKIFSDDDKSVQNLNRTIASVLRKFERENYTKTVVYESKYPFIGLYRECLIVISTKALELLNKAELLGSIAHELAHEIFIDEMIKADQTDNNELRHTIEYKCDLVAVMSTFDLIENPLALVNGVSKFSKWYEDNPTSLEIHQDWSPTISNRKHTINSFLNSNSAFAGKTNSKK